MKKNPWPQSVSELYRPSDRCRILDFLYWSRYYFFQVAHIYSQGWVDPVPDPLLLRKYDSAGIEPGATASVARNSDHRSGHHMYHQCVLVTWFDRSQLLAAVLKHLKNSFGLVTLCSSELDFSEEDITCIFNIKLITQAGNCLPWLVSCLAYSRALNTQALCSPETLGLLWTTQPYNLS
jgi:hypothetical protein